MEKTLAPQKHRLTTIDNPYNPHSQFTQWLLYDNEHDYNTCGMLARITNTTEEMTDEEIDAEVERAIDEIIYHDFLNIYKKV